MRDHRTRVKWVFRPGYTAEQYDAVRAACVDGEKLPETYELWAKYALASDHRMQKLGRFVVRINIDLEPFRDWCTGHGRPLDKDARMAYAEAIGEQRRAKLS